MPSKYAFFTESLYRNSNRAHRPLPGGGGAWYWGTPPMGGLWGGPFGGPMAGSSVLLPVSPDPGKNVPDYFSVLGYLAQNAHKLLCERRFWAKITEKWLFTEKYSGKLRKMADFGSILSQNAVF